MSTIILSVVIIMLLVVCTVLLFKYRSQTIQINQIESELEAHLHQKRKEKILIITSEKAIQRLLTKVNQLIDIQQELERTQRYQEENSRKMLSNISHDLKTPLTVILGYTEMLRTEDAELDNTTMQRIEKIYQKAKDVLAMIEEFFDVVKIEAGEYLMQCEPIDICEVCREEVLSFYQLIKASKIDMKVEMDENPIMIEGDRMALKRVLSNLIDNAVKYGSDGRYLKIKVYQNAKHKFIEVIDHGKGIVEDHQDKIFERLFTLEDSRNKKYQGSGLGLTITKRLVEAMDGSLTLKSIPYKETIFTIRF